MESNQKTMVNGPDLMEQVEVVQVGPPRRRPKQLLVAQTAKTWFKNPECQANWLLNVLPIAAVLHGALACSPVIRQCVPRAFTVVRSRRVLVAFVRSRRNQG